jgi:hypothetical protein
LKKDEIDMLENNPNTTTYICTLCATCNETDPIHHSSTSLDHTQCNIKSPDQQTKLDNKGTFVKNIDMKDIFFYILSSHQN